MALMKKTAAELSELLANKEISAVELAKDVFARTAAVEDKVQGYVTLTEEAALQQAEAVDKKRAAGEDRPRSPAFPVAIKDNICTKGTLTTLRVQDALQLQAAVQCDGHGQARRARCGRDRQGEYG